MSELQTKPLTSSQIGRYQIRSLLGKGSMGVVFLAHDPQLDREVAIKTIQLAKHHKSSERTLLIQKLIKEARLAARLNHPGIVPVFDYGENQGEPYLVMERIEGDPLSELIARQESLEPEFATRTLSELLAAMAYAHEQGVIHRDLKPANIMIQPDGRARIMDFGIAYATFDPNDGNETLAGTPRYMSPEQIQGRPVDIRSDIFSLGVVFYEMLSGRRPFPQAEFATLREAIINQPHPPLQTIRPELPVALCALVDRALCKRPAERFGTAKQMLEALKLCPSRQETGQGEPALNAHTRGEIIDFILQRITRKGDFPTTMQYISDITQAARNQNASARTISETILKDFALTNRILRMVNSPFYSGVGRSISTISRAVVILGVDVILDVAAALSIFEHFQNRSDVAELKFQTVHALMTAIHAREIARQIQYEHAEEAFICGMLHHLGRLIVAFYFPEEFKAINDLIRQGALDESSASRKIMRVTFCDLGEAVAQSWHLPESVYRGIRGLDQDHQGALRTSDQKLQGIISYAHELGKATMMSDEVKRKAFIADLARQFEGIIDISPKHLARIVEDSVRNAWDISHTLRVNLKDLGIATPLLQEGENAAPGLANETMSDPLEESTPSQLLADPLDDSYPGNLDSTVAERQNFLMKAIGEVAMALTSPFHINDILMMVLEGMYRGVGFQHVLLALVNPARDHVYCRFGLGPQNDEVREALHFPLSFAGGLPARCILEAKEIFVADIDEGKRRGSFPTGCLELLGAKSIVMMPILVQDSPIGLFFLDRTADYPPINKQDLLNLRTLCSQSVLAIRQSQANR